MFKIMQFEFTLFVVLFTVTLARTMEVSRYLPRAIYEKLACSTAKAMPNWVFGNFGKTIATPGCYHRVCDGAHYQFRSVSIEHEVKTTVVQCG